MHSLLKQPKIDLYINKLAITLKELALVNVLVRALK